MLRLRKVLICTCWLAHLWAVPYNPCSRRPMFYSRDLGRSYQGCSPEASSARPSLLRYRRWRRRRGLANLRRRPSYQGRRRRRRRRCRAACGPETRRAKSRRRGRWPKGPTPMWIACAASKYLDADDNARLSGGGVDRRVFVETSAAVSCGLAWCESPDEVPFGVVSYRGVPLCFTPSTRRCVCSMARRFHAIDATSTRVTRAPAAGASSKRGRCTILVETPRAGDSIGFTKKLRLGTRAYEARFSKDEIALRSLALKVTEAMLDVSMIKKKPVEPIEQPKKKAFRTIRKEITLRADLATAARGPSLDAWWASMAPGCEADGAWHDITASKEVAAAFSPKEDNSSLSRDTADDSRARETIYVSEASLPPDRFRARSGPWRRWRARPSSAPV